MNISNGTLGNVNNTVPVGNSMQQGQTPMGTGGMSQQNYGQQSTGDSVKLSKPVRHNSDWANNSELTLPQDTFSNGQQYGGQQNNGQQNYEQGFNNDIPNGYGQPQYNAYGNYQQPMYPAKKPVIGIVALVLSILSLVCCGVPFGTAGIICGLIALIKHKDKKGLAAIIVGIISILLWILIICTGLVSFNSIKFSTSYGDTEESIEYNFDEATEYEDGAIIDEDFSVEVEETTDENIEELMNETGEVNDAFNDKKVVLNGKELIIYETTPAEVEEIFNLKFSESDLDSVVKTDYYDTVDYYLYDGTFNHMSFSFYNNTK